MRTDANAMPDASGRRGRDAAAPDARASVDASPPPADAARDAAGPLPEASSSSEDSGTPILGNCRSATLVPPRDPEWANWPVPPDAPTAYSVGPDVVCDEVTGLLWQRVTKPTVGENVETYCQSLLGLSGWRLPTAVELASVVSYDGRGLDPVFASISGCYWASTQVPPSPTYLGGQFTASIPDGTLKAFDASSGCRWLCVHAPWASKSASGPGAARGRYKTTAATVEDVVTRLTWQRVATVGDAAAALATCDSLVLGGASDWRLPRVKELYTLSDHRDGGRLDATVFPTDRDVTLWSSTLGAGAPSGEGWTVDFGDGSTTRRPTSEPHAARCVRP